MRKHLSADALLLRLRHCFERICDHRSGNPVISLTDALMSGYAVFALKDTSLLQFDKRRKEEPQNLKTIFKLAIIPCDTQMRTILDEVNPEQLRLCYKALFSALQRGKALEEMVYLDQYYLMPMDGTEYFSSEKLQSPYCMERTSSVTGVTTYYLQTLAAALVHPDRKEVIPLMPEPIFKQDGATKNDCEMNASRRFLLKLRKDHPHLKIIVTQDSISPNGPYIRFLMEHGFRFILHVKESDHGYLFKQLNEAIETGDAGELVLQDPKDPDKFHSFRWVNGLSINASHKNVRVNVLQYREVRGKQSKYFSWVTDFTLTAENVYQVMRGGRARWKVENEVFNTVKNQGYNFEHNYGLGEKYLSMVFVNLMMLAFLVDQTQQLCCTLFQSVWKKVGSKKALWETIRALFHCFLFDSMQMLYLAILHGFQKDRPIIQWDTS